MKIIKLWANVGPPNRAKSKCWSHNSYPLTAQFHDRFFPVFEESVQQFRRFRVHYIDIYIFIYYIYNTYMNLVYGKLSYSELFFNTVLRTMLVIFKVAGYQKVWLVEYIYYIINVVVQKSTMMTLTVIKKISLVNSCMY